VKAFLGALSSPGIWRIVLLVTAVSVFALAWQRLLRASPAPGFAVPAISAPMNIRSAGYGVQDVSHGVTPFTHSAAAVEVPGRGLLAFWYGGTREGSADCAIYMARLDTASGVWGAERMLINREALQAGLRRSIRKIGNPTVVRGRDGALHLFFVSVSLGGWSGSAINMLTSHDGGESWSALRRLITSPFLNISTLVKGEPLLYPDASIGLPVYHEFAGKFGELLRLGPGGRVLYKQRLSSGRYALQPVLAPGSRDAAVGFMRYAGAPPRRVLMLRSGDGGQSWTVPEKTVLANPDSAVAAMRLAGGGLLLAFNDSESGRHNLSLAHSLDDGLSWRVIHVVEDAGAESKAEFSYPWLLRTADGDGHLLYTGGKRRIRHARFNLAWLEQKLR